MPVRKGVALKVIIDGTLIENARVHQIETSLGGGRWDHAVIEFDIGWNKKPSATAPKHLQDLVGANSLAVRPGGIDKQCLIVGNVNGKERVFHWGFIEANELDISDGEYLKPVSRTSEVCFGFPIGFQRVYDPKSKTANWNSPAGSAGVYIDDEVNFNPDHPLEEKCDANMRITYGTSALWFGVVPGTGVDYNLFIHPEAFRTPSAAAIHNVSSSSLVRVLTFRNEAAMWTLIDAVMYCCGECNGPEIWKSRGGSPYIANPTLAELSDKFSLDANLFGGRRGLLRGHKITPGQYLPHVLDDLLEPYGFTWYVKHESRSSRKIVVVPHGKSRVSVKIKLQKPGEELNTDKSHVESLQIDFDAGRLANRVRVVGAKTQVEASFELTPGWDKDLDKTRLDMLMSNVPDWDKADHQKYHPVWRKWVLNEAGDYPRGKWKGKGYDLTSLFQHVFGAAHPPVVPHRRRFLPTMTLKDEKKPIGEHSEVHVEWYDVYTEKWKPIDAIETDWTARLLHDEAGIEFTGPLPPVLLWTSTARDKFDADKARVRVTATIESDYRISHTAAPNIGLSKLKDWFKLLSEPALLLAGIVAGIRSPTVQARELFVDKHRSFHARLLAKSNSSKEGGIVGSIYEPKVAAKELFSREEDSRSLVIALAEALRDANDFISCSGTIKIEGMDRSQYSLATTVKKISNREIDLDTSGGKTGGRKPQIIGIRYFPQQQYTTVQFGSYKETDTYMTRMLLSSHPARSVS